jgi:hypothetical protein
VAKVVTALKAATEAMAAWVVPPPPLVHVHSWGNSHDLCGRVIATVMGAPSGSGLPDRPIVIAHRAVTESLPEFWICIVVAFSQDIHVKAGIVIIYAGKVDELVL